MTVWRGGQDGTWPGGPRGRGPMYTCGPFMLMYGRNQPKGIILQLKLNFFKKSKKKSSWTTHILWSGDLWQRQTWKMELKGRRKHQSGRSLSSSFPAHPPSWIADPLGQQVKFQEREQGQNKTKRQKGEAWGAQEERKSKGEKLGSPS